VLALRTIVIGEKIMECPFPIREYPRITMAHGGGGRLTQILIEKMFLPLFGQKDSHGLHDGAVLHIKSDRLAFSTDGFVVKPLFFPGGDIGKLSVYGTLNDLAMCGARGKALSVSFILEEGLSTEVLERIVRSMGEAAKSQNIEIVAGDTKVVERGKCDGVYITTTGVGEIASESGISPAEIRPGDQILLSGDLGRHGIAVLGEREGFHFQSKIESDCAPLWPSVNALLRGGVRVRCLRDLTRGGLASALVEISESSGFSLEVDEKAIPVREEVRGACEMLGLDPIHIANEGRFVAFVDEKDSDRALELLRGSSESFGAVRIGQVAKEKSAQVWLKGILGRARLLIMLSGEQLPRIC
jgi:hydrogenase expression/formation protein HypE